MTVRNLDYLLRPRSIAVIGASNRPASLGRTVMRNLLIGDFNGSILPVNPNHRTVAGVLSYPSVGDLPITPDLALICTPPATVPALVAELGNRGTKAAIILTAGFEIAQQQTGIDYRQAILDAARPHLMRLLGPNCVGLLSPHVGLNASFAPAAAQPGKIAFVTQSGALATTVLDWANSRDIGFSHFISLGNCWDVDFGDVLDYLGSDPDTHSILLYIESVTGARKFMSAARAASRNKPVIVIKAGRRAEGAAAAASHTGALAGSDIVYDAAIRRAGMLRVGRIEDLFNTAELLGRDMQITGDRLVVMTNGGGAGVMAADAIGEDGATLTELSEETIAKLDEVLPVNWSRRNPIDIIGDAPTERYAKTLEILADCPEIDATLLIQAPTAINPSIDIAEALLPIVKRSPHPILTCWLGGNTAQAARALYSANRIPDFDTPEKAVDAFSHLVDLRNNRALLAETPPSLPAELRPDRQAAAQIIAKALAEGRSLLSEPEAKEIMACYEIPVVETRVVADTDEALAAADAIGYPVALKILSDDISHKSDVGGVVLDIEDGAQLGAATVSMRERIAALLPNAAIKGFTVQSMARRPQAFELILGAKEDSVFGPILLFGQGGTSVEITGDQAVGLPPMNLTLARHLVEETRISKLLKGYRDRKAVDLEAVYLSIVKIAQLIADLPEVVELDINPLLADSDGVIALDARISIKPSAVSGIRRLAIRPYPKELEETVDISDEKILLRPIRPEDEDEHRRFLETMAPDDIQFRFFGSIKRFGHAQLARLTQIDFDREMAFIAVRPDTGPDNETLGVIRIISDPDNIEAEFALIVHSSMQERGLGNALMHKMIDYCRQRGMERIVGDVLPANQPMLALATKYGFVQDRPTDERVIKLRLDLKALAPSGTAIKR